MVKRQQKERTMTDRKEYMKELMRKKRANKLTDANKKLTKGVSSLVVSKPVSKPVSKDPFSIDPISIDPIRPCLECDKKDALILELKQLLEKGKKRGSHGRISLSDLPYSKSKQVEGFNH